MSKTYRRAYIKTCEAFGWEGGPGYSTEVIGLYNGNERTRARWDQPQHFFNLPFLNLLPEQYAPIKQMHLNCRGCNGRFLYRDRLDDRATNELVGVATAGQKVFELGKLSVIDGVSYFRKVRALYSPNPDGSANQETPVVTVNNVSTTAFTVDYDRGTITLTNGLAAGDAVRWSGRFSLWVRFNNDRLPFSIDNKSGDEFVVNGLVELLEMKSPKVGEV